MSFRNKKIEELIKQEVALIISKEILFPKDSILTIVSVSLYNKGYSADVFVSVIPDQKLNECLAILKKNVYHIQQELNDKLNIKPVPKLIFKQDTKTKEDIHLEEVFQKIHDDLAR